MSVRVLSVDLAYVRPTDIGLAVIDEGGRRGAVARVLPADLLGLTPPLRASQVASALSRCAEREGCSGMTIDGPQAWKAEDNGLVHSRVCDRSLNAPAKVGIPGQGKPRTYIPFIVFSIAVFGALAELGWQLLLSDAQPDASRRIVTECLPLAGWRSLGLRPLPAKRRCPSWMIPEFQRQLVPYVDLDGPCSHDQLQAVVGGLGMLSLCTGRANRYRLAGSPPILRNETWREGYIVCPLPNAL